jgi:hypothetical protein
MEEKLDNAIRTAKGIIPALTQPIDIQKASQAVLNLQTAKAMYAGFRKGTTEFDDELSFVLGKVRSNVAAHEMQQVTQAALHLMHAKAHCEPESKPTKTKTAKAE